PPPLRSPAPHHPPQLHTAHSSPPHRPARRRGGTPASPGPPQREVGQRPVILRITSSACCSSAGGIVRPRAWAVLRLITSSNLVGCWTGRSAGLAPLRIRPA